MSKYMITYKIVGMMNMTNKTTRVEAKSDKLAVKFLKDQLNVKIKVLYIFEIK